MTVKIYCHNCIASGPAELPDASMGFGLLACPECGLPILDIELADSPDLLAWVEGQVDRRMVLPSRRQARLQSDRMICTNGLRAELAAAMILCPASLPTWMRSVESAGANRGRDIEPRFTGLPKPVEVKHTSHCSATRGFLLVRPPRRTPGRMRFGYIDDSLYVLMSGGPTRFAATGWADRETFDLRGVSDPVPRGEGQRECIGIHWLYLRAIPELGNQMEEERTAT